MMNKAKISKHTKLTAVLIASMLLLSGCQGQLKDLVGNGSVVTTKDSNTPQVTEAAKTEAAVTEAPVVISEPAAEQTDPPVETTDGSLLSMIVRPEFKEVMDSYETFIDEYVAFMKKYQNADAMDMLGMMSDYADYMQKYSDFVDKVDKWTSDMNDLESAYYAEVSLRVSKKLLEAAA